MNAVTGWVGGGKQQRAAAAQRGARSVRCEARSKSAVGTPPPANAAAAVLMKRIAGFPKKTVWGFGLLEETQESSWEGLKASLLLSSLRATVGDVACVLCQRVRAVGHKERVLYYDYEANVCDTAAPEHGCCIRSSSECGPSPTRAPPRPLRGGARRVIETCLTNGGASVAAWVLQGSRLLLRHWLWAGKRRGFPDLGHGRAANEPRPHALCARTHTAHVRAARRRQKPCSRVHKAVPSCSVSITYRYHLTYLSYSHTSSHSTLIKSSLGRLAKPRTQSHLLRSPSPSSLLASPAIQTDRKREGTHSGIA